MFISEIVLPNFAATEKTNYQLCWNFMLHSFFNLIALQVNLLWFARNGKILLIFILLL